MGFYWSYTLLLKSPVLMRSWWCPNQLSSSPHLHLSLSFPPTLSSMSSILFLFPLSFSPSFSFLTLSPLPFPLSSQDSSKQEEETQVTTKTMYSGNLSSSRRCLECGQLNSKMAKKCLQCRSPLQGKPCPRWACGAGSSQSTCSTPLFPLAYITSPIFFSYITSPIFFTPCFLLPFLILFSFPSPFSSHVSFSPPPPFVFLIPPLCTCTPSSLSLPPSPTPHRCGRPNLNHSLECFKCGMQLPPSASKWVYVGSHSGRGRFFIHSSTLHLPACYVSLLLSLSSLLSPLISPLPSHPSSPLSSILSLSPLLSLSSILFLSYLN